MNLQLPVSDLERIAAAVQVACCLSDEMGWGGRIVREIRRQVSAAKERKVREFHKYERSMEK